MVTEQKELTQREIDRLVERGGRFLRAIGTKKGIQRMMIELGYNQDQHSTGWRLYLALCGYHIAGQESITVSNEEKAVQAAITEIDNWDEPHFARAHAALGHFFPEQNAYLFNQLTAEQGIAAMGSVNIFLDRVKALREGMDSKRANTREQDREAMMLLEKRGIIDQKEEQRLRGLMAKVQQVMNLSAENITDEEMKYQQQMQDNALEFSRWLDDWRTTARAGITRRDYLISLGLANRRTVDETTTVIETEETDKPSV